MANDNAPAAEYYVYISSASDLRLHLDFYPAPRVGFKVRGNLSAAEYQKIEDAVYSGNSSLDRQDFIANPRIQPFGPLPSIRIRNVNEMNQAIECHGSNFCCRVPDEMPWNVVQAVAAVAAQHNVQQDTWSG